MAISDELIVIWALSSLSMPPQCAQERNRRGASQPRGGRFRTGGVSRNRTGVNDRTVQVLREVGIEVSDAKPGRVTRQSIERAHRVISLGCPVEPELASAAEDKLEEWPMPDTTGRPVGAVREVRDLIGARVDRLLDELRSARG